MKLNKLKQNYDYILPLIIWIMIFGKNIFSSLMFVDYAPDTHLSMFNSIILTNYTQIFNPIDLLRLILAPLHLLSILYQFSILITMFVSYFYIRKLFSDKEKLFSVLFAFIYFFNPFVYSRIMVGQFAILISYLLLPLTIYYIFQFYESNLKLKPFLKMTLAITLCSLPAIHFFAINFIILLVTAVWLYFYKNKFSIKDFSVMLLSFLIFLLLLNAFWIQGMFSNPILKTIDSSHEDFFAPKLSTNIPAVAKIMGMYGFWRENAYSTTYTQFNSTTYYILLFILLILMLSSYYTSHDKKSKIFFTLFWIGLIFGTGISHPYTRPFFNSLFNYLPFFNGFRDSHKLVSLICLAYAYFIPISILKLKSSMKSSKILKPILILLTIIFIILFTYPLLGLSNQIKPISYPQSYFELNSYFNQEQVEGKIIYLPWQTYLTYTWTKESSSDGRIAVPINQILKYPVIVGPDLYGAETLENNKITLCLNDKSIPCLEENSVQYILIDKCSLFKEENTWITNNLSNKAYSNACIDVYKLNSTSQNKQIPLRFILGSLISILTLSFIILLIIKDKKI